MATILGAAVNFGFTGTDGIASSILTGKIFLQSAEHSKAADEEQIKNGVGDLVTRSFYGLRERATIEFISTGATITVARTNSIGQTLGTIVSITACADLPGLVYSYWIVVGSSVNGSNTTAKTVTLNLEKIAAVTAAAGA